MAITVNGLVSGLDSAGIVSKLVELEKRPVTLLQDKQTAGNDQLTAWQELNTKLKAFQTSAQKINSATKFQGTKGTFTNDISTAPSIVSLSSTANVTSATYSLTVGSLAAQQKMVSNQSFDSTSSTLMYNSVTITSGGQTKTFTQKTLDSLTSAINTSGMGLSAVLINTGASTPSYRMEINGANAGAASAFTVSVDQGSNGVGQNPNSLDFATTQVAKDASITLDGVTVSRTSNNFDNVIPGVNLTVTATGSGKVNFNADATVALANINDFVNTYNDVIDYTTGQSTFDKTQQKQKPLFGNTTMLNIQQTLRGIVTGAVGGLANTKNQYGTLSQVGIKTDYTNHLTVDSTVLSQALQANISGVTNLFVSGASGSYTFVAANGSVAAGVYDTLYSGGTMKMRMKGSSGDWINMTQSGNYFDGALGSALEGFSLRADASALSEGTTGNMTIWTGAAVAADYQTQRETEYSTTGLIYNARKSLEDRNVQYQAQIDDMNQRIKIKQDNLTQKYARLESTLSKIKGQGDYLSQQLNYLPAMMTPKKK